MSQPMLQVDGLVKKFDSITAVAGISFSVDKGEVLGFLGPNGAGKSTTMKMITGFLTPTAGSVTICGHDIATDSIEARTVVGYLPEGAPAYGDMTPRQFLDFVAEVRGFSGDKKEASLSRAVARTQLDSVLDQPIDTLSKGFKRRVGLAQAIFHDPPVLIMDEPTDGLDPNQKFAVRRLIATMAKDKAIIISTHILEEVDAVCSRAMIIDKGLIVADGTPEDMAARSRYHNAVTVHIGPHHTASARQAFDAIDAVDEIHEATLADGAVAFTLFPKKARRIIESVSALVSDKDWDIRALIAEGGHLDEVFRQCTTADAAPAVIDRAATSTVEESGRTEA